MMRINAKISNISKTITTVLLGFLLVLFLKTDISAQVVINEFVPDASTEWVEFFNASDSAEYLKTYYLDDDTDFSSDTGSSDKKFLSTLNVSNFQYPFFELTSFLNNGGDWVVLFSPDGTIVDKYLYSSNPGNNFSIGRSPDHTGEFVILSSPTKGAENSAPLPTPTSTPTDTPTPTSNSTPTSTSTPTPSPTPKPTATSKLTFTPTPKPTEATPEVGQEENLVLGLREELNSVQKTATTAEDNKKFPFLAAVFIFLGLGIMGFAAASFLRNRKKGYNGSDAGTGGESLGPDNQEGL